MLHDKIWMKNAEYSCCVLVDGGRNACMQFACKPFNAAQTALKGFCIYYAKILATKQQNTKNFGVSFLMCCCPILGFGIFAKILGTKQAPKKNHFVCHFCYSVR
jgi:hypothetical protein